MARSTLLAAGVLTAALAAGGAAGLILGTPTISGAQEGSTTTQDDGTTTAPDDGTTAPEAGDDATAPDGERPEGCAEGEGRGGGAPAPEGEAPADAPVEGSSTASA